ncbi:MAG: hypothetical protein ABI462_10610 [Ignavibacteria bacterium]
MGTSVSQGSPKTSNWKPVFACYENDKFSKERVINEIWRASEKEATPISVMMKTDAIYECYNAISNSQNYREALQKFNDVILNTKQNSIVAEFARRVIPIAFQSEKPIQQWKNSFFTELTNYVVSRDTSGFVGENYRIKSVTDLIAFKRSIATKVNEIIGANKVVIRSKSDWSNFIDSSITKLKSVK